MAVLNYNDGYNLVKEVLDDLGEDFNSILYVKKRRFTTFEKRLIKAMKERDDYRNLAPAELFEKVYPSIIKKHSPKIKIKTGKNKFELDFDYYAQKTVFGGYIVSQDYVYENAKKSGKVKSSYAWLIFLVIETIRNTLGRMAWQHSALND